MIYKICEKCGKEYPKPATYSQRKWDKSRVCSFDCRKKGEDRTCPTCGKGFYAKRCHIEKGFMVYCSRSCAKKGKIPPNLKIAQAASPINKKGYPSHLKGKKRQLSAQWYENTKKANYKRGLKGNNHWNWKGGITPQNMLLRNRPDYTEWRKSIYARDGWDCQQCGIHCDAGNIVAHHIKVFKDYPELRYEPRNGTTLCRKCHASLHHFSHEMNEVIYGNHNS